jgi:hypothetical protein
MFGFCEAESRFPLIGKPSLPFLATQQLIQSRFDFVMFVSSKNAVFLTEGFYVQYVTEYFFEAFLYIAGISRH